MVTLRYGKRLSSRSRTLNGGWWRLMRLASRISASTSLVTTIVRTSATRSTIFAVRYACAAESWKYERTRLRSETALPM